MIKIILSDRIRRKVTKREQGQRLLWKRETNKQTNIEMTSGGLVASI